MTLQELQRRRRKLLDQMQTNSAAILFAAPEVTRSADSEYPYCQNRDFWYFTEFNEPEAALLLIKYHDGSTKSVVFNRVRDLFLETWYGRRLGQEAALVKLGVDEAYRFVDIEEKLVGLLNGLDVVYHAFDLYPYADEIMQHVFHTLRQGSRKGFSAPNSITDWRPFVHEMRLFKSPEEIAVMRKAGEITAKGHIRAMQHSAAGRYEYHLEAEILHEFMQHGARYPSYNTIVGSGENGCILHYTENESELLDGNMIMIDAGCEYQGYAGDISRSFPVNGRFTPAQREIYGIVLASQKRAIELLVPGNSIHDADKEVIRIMVEGLVKLGVMKGDVDELIEKRAYRQFYMHSLSHWLGLDVHDVGDYGNAEKGRVLEPGMVLTVEPGLYIAAHPDVPEAYHNIGIRIEDNLLMTDAGNEVLTALAPKEIDAIEALMAKGL